MDAVIMVKKRFQLLPWFTYITHNYAFEYTFIQQKKQQH